MADTKLSALTELAATPANDDEVYIRDVSEAASAESKRITIANLIAATDTATKSLWTPVTFANVGIAQHGMYPAALLQAANDYANTVLRMPYDFNSITTAIIVTRPAVIESALNWDIYADYGAMGETHNQHSESDEATTYDATGYTTGKLFPVDISGILSSLAANDYIGIKILLADSGDDMRVFGVYFRYS